MQLFAFATYVKRLPLQQQTNNNHSFLIFSNSIFSYFSLSLSYTLSLSTTSFSVCLSIVYYLYFHSILRLLFSLTPSTESMGAGKTSGFSLVERLKSLLGGFSGSKPVDWLWWWSVGVKCRNTNCVGVLQRLQRTFFVKSNCKFFQN